MPTRAPIDARRLGRYALENDEHVDVLVARALTTLDGDIVEFGDVWLRRQSVPLGDGVDIVLPSMQDLIRTTRAAAGPKDLEDIRLLQILAEEKIRAP